MHRSIIACCWVALSLPVFPGAAAAPFGDAGETIRISRTGIPCAGICMIYDLDVAPDGLVRGWVRKKILSRDDLPVEKIRFVVAAADAARFRAILHAYRPTRTSRKGFDCYGQPHPPLLQSFARFQTATVTEIGWSGFGPAQQVVTCDDDPSGLIAIVDRALQALGLDPDGHKIEAGH